MDATNNAAAIDKCLVNIKSFLPKSGAFAVIGHSSIAFASQRQRGKGACDRRIWLQIPISLE
jgi:hypothetical protein